MFELFFKKLVIFFSSRKEKRKSEGKAHSELSQGDVK